MRSAGGVERVVAGVAIGVNEAAIAGQEPVSGNSCWSAVGLRSNTVYGLAWSPT